MKTTVRETEREAVRTKRKPVTVLSRGKETVKEDVCDAFLQSCLNLSRKGTTQKRRRNPSIITGEETQKKETEGGIEVEEDGGVESEQRSLVTQALMSVWT